MSQVRTVPVLPLLMDEMGCLINPLLGPVMLPEVGGLECWVEHCRLKKVSHHTLRKSGGRTHCDAVDSNVIGAQIVLIKDDLTTCCSRTHHVRDCWVSLEFFNVLCEDVNVGDHILNECMLVGAHLVSCEEEGL